MKQNITFYLNGEIQEVGANFASMTLSDFLRYEKCLTGTKVVCAEGDCGACSVLKYFPTNQGVDTENFIPINSCIQPVATLHGSHIITVEALEKTDRLHESQRAMVENHGSQCGFCTPGFVMALAGLCEEKLARGEKSIDENEAKNCMTGNLCRCTGYEGIINAAKDIDLSKEESLKKRYHNEIIEKDLLKLQGEEVYIESTDYSFYAPTSIEKACEYLCDNENVRIIASATDLGVVHNKRKIKLSKLMSLHLIDETHLIEEKDGEIHVGARVTLTELRHFLKGKIDEFSRYLDVFASPLIKNNATLVGNIATASPIGDNAPVLLSLGAKIVLKSKTDERTIKLSDFFLDYRKTAMKPGELITKLIFPTPKSSSSFKLYKNCVRKDMDISIVNMAINLEKDHDRVGKIRIAAGGISAIPLRLKETEKFLIGKEINSENIHKACEVAQKEFNPLSDHRSSAAYRRVTVDNYIKRFFSEEVSK